MRFSEETSSVIYNKILYLCGGYWLVNLGIIERNQFHSFKEFYRTVINVEKMVYDFWWWKTQLFHEFGGVINNYRLTDNLHDRFERFFFCSFGHHIQQSCWSSDGKRSLSCVYCKWRKY